MPCSPPPCRVSSLSMSCSRAATSTSAPSTGIARRGDQPRGLRGHACHALASGRRSRRAGRESASSCTAVVAVGDGHAPMLPAWPARRDGARRATPARIGPQRGGRPSVTTSTLPSRSRPEGAGRARRRGASSVSGGGWPYSLSSADRDERDRGCDGGEEPGDVLECEPWCPTFSTSTRLEEAAGGQHRLDRRLRVAGQQRGEAADSRSSSTTDALLMSPSGSGAADVVRRWDRGRRSGRPAPRRMRSPARAAATRAPRSARGQLQEAVVGRVPIGAAPDQDHGRPEALQGGNSPADVVLVRVGQHQHVDPPLPERQPLRRGGAASGPDPARRRSAPSRR